MSGALASLALGFAGGAAVGALHLALLWAGTRALPGRRGGARFLALAAARAGLVIGAAAGALALGAGAGALLAGLLGFLAARLAATRAARPRPRPHDGGSAWR